MRPGVDNGYHPDYDAVGNPPVALLDTYGLRFATGQSRPRSPCVAARTPSPTISILLERPSRIQPLEPMLTWSVTDVLPDSRHVSGMIRRLPPGSLAPGAAAVTFRGSPG